MKSFSNFSKSQCFYYSFTAVHSMTVKEESESGDLCTVRILSQYLPSQIPSKYSFWEVIKNYLDITKSSHSPEWGHQKSSSTHFYIKC